MSCNDLGPVSIHSQRMVQKIRVTTLYMHVHYKLLIALHIIKD